MLEETTLAELRGLRIAGEGERIGTIPTLDELLEALPPELPINVELKRDHADARVYAERVLAEVGWRSATTLVSSYDWSLLARLQRIAPRISVSPVAKRRPGAALENARRWGSPSLHLHRRFAPPEVVDEALSFGCEVYAYTVNDADEARQLTGRGISGLFTDRPREIRAALAAG